MRNRLALLTLLAPSLFAADVTFLRDVAPILNKVGCTSGPCHGAAKGKNGFKLSLRGYDPEWDHQALTDELEGRRFNRAAPERSLMLLKPAGEAPHVGGMLFKQGDPYYEIIKAWIAAGVKPDASRYRELDRGGSDASAARRQAARRQSARRVHAVEGVPRDDRRGDSRDMAVSEECAG